VPAGDVYGGNAYMKKHQSLAILEKPFVVMGVLNVTPDSFYDGGRHNLPQDAFSHAQKLIDEGADIIDIGGESTRPGAKPVPAAREIERVVAVIEQIRKHSSVIISIDTTKADVAREALAAGATWINDISAGRFDAKMAPLAAEKACPVVLMHSRKTPENMQAEPYYENVVDEVRDELLQSIAHFTARDVAGENILIDPGIGFAKRFEDNIALLNNLDTLTALGYPVCIGTSRKSFLAPITGRQADERLAATLASVGVAYSRKAKVFRVHDVQETVDYLKVVSAIEHG
jgi:dihydropteroate synthase